MVTISSIELMMMMIGRWEYLDIISDVGVCSSAIAHFTSVQFNPQRWTIVVLRMYRNFPCLHSTPATTT